LIARCLENAKPSVRVGRKATGLVDKKDSRVAEGLLIFAARLFYLMFLEGACRPERGISSSHKSTNLLNTCAQRAGAAE
jgi:hypothetical protein